MDGNFNPVVGFGHLAGLMTTSLSLNTPESNVASELTATRLLVVDDEPEIRKVLVRFLMREGYECVEAGSGSEALGLFRKNPFDAVLSDIRMPGMSGIDFIREVRAADDEVAVVMVTANDEARDAVSSMRNGADDYILKPFNFQDVRLGLGRALERRRLKRQIREYRVNLESMVAQRTSQLQNLYVSVIQSLVHTLEAKDPYTDGHSRRVGWMALQLGIAVGLDARDLEIVRLGGVFHDLGKIGIKEAVLLKTGPLTDGEWDHIRTHPEIGVRILKPIEDFREILPIVRHHHEQFDGGGYPFGLRGEKIPLVSRIVTLVDVFDALTSARPYRGAMRLDEALEYIREASQTHFDPELVRVFVPIAESSWFQQSLFSKNWSISGDSHHTLVPRHIFEPSPAVRTIYCEQ